jgi:hypothetical protein
MGGYCEKERIACELAGDNGCLVSSCIKPAKWNYTHSQFEQHNITTPPKRADGLYAQLFAVKDGVRYDMKTVSLAEITNAITNSLMDGIEKLCV